ncbi:hypothetical protein PV327_007555 [Microctonus hyperodae]|uniref:AB hydrolase-1 domain-containing protein n=1 Tax=Microctonus hyperodae TaxID=165561 RepID=A0AA39FZV3_MICHY|nr:hypothetical protein PV327_007555 [Microctonus hyperodae]
MLTIIYNNLLRGIKLSGLKYLQRGINSNTSINLNRKYKEVEIKVPWGKLTGKHWGPTNIQPIIAVHGWQDNAASFDPLMNYISEDNSILAIDLPGHGKSSWIPNGFIYDFLIYTQTIDRIRQHYNMDKIAIIGHSMGGMISFNYACNFPQNMKFIAALDYYKCPPWNANKYQRRFTKEWQQFFKLEKNITASPCYEESDLMKKSIEATGNSLNESTCKILYSRGTKKNPDGTISFTRDPRVKYFTLSNIFTHEYMKDIATRLNFPYRILKGENCDFNESEESYYDVMKVIENRSEDFKYHIVPGTHHFHMDNPEGVAKILNPFIAKYR